jgi:hypothetical protein
VGQAFRREHDDDVLACAESRRARRSESGGSAVARRMLTGSLQLEGRVNIRRLWETEQVEDSRGGRRWPRKENRRLLQNQCGSEELTWQVRKKSFSMWLRRVMPRC